MKRKITAICLTIILAFMFGCAKDNNEEKPKKMTLYSNPYRIYVTLNGNDTNNGATTSTAVKSIDKAIELAKQAEPSAEFDAIVITMDKGVYVLSQTLSITQTISSNLPLVFEGSKSDVTELNGAEQIVGGWTVFDQAKGVYKRNVGKQDFRQLYVDGSFAIRARYPNYTDDISADHITMEWDNDKRIINLPEYVASDIDATAIEGSEIHFVQDWTQTIGIIESVSTAGGITAIALENNWLKENLFTRKYPFRRNDQMAWLENSLSYLDAENEWYFDRESGDLYYKPLSGVDINSLSFSIPRINSVVSIEGTRESAVENIAFSNITFSGSNWTYPSSGYLDNQAGLHFVDTTDKYEKGPALFSAAYCKNLTILGCTIKNAGNTGLDLSIGVKNSKVVGNVFNRIAGTAISMGYFGETNPLASPLNYGYSPSDTREITEHNEISNNYINQVGTSFKGGSTGILGGYVRYIDILHNEIHDIAYSGIGIGWGWEWPQTILTGINIKNNKIYDVMNHLAYDGAPIYLLGQHKLTGDVSVISNNYMELEHGLGGLYFDEYSRYFIAENNVIEGSGRHGVINFHDCDGGINGVTISKTYGTESTVYFQTYWKDGTSSVTKPIKAPELRSVFVEDIILAKTGGKWSKEAQSIIDNSGLEEAYKDIK